MKIYLSMAIDKNPGAVDQFDSIRKELISEIRTGENGLVIFSPGQAFSVSGRIKSPESKYIFNVNDLALRESDVVILVYTPGIESWGSPMELMVAALGHNLPVFVLIKDKPDALSLFVDLPTYIKALVPEGRVHWNINGLILALEDFLL